MPRDGDLRSRTITWVAHHEDQKRISRALDRRDVLRCGRRWGKTTLLENKAGRWASKGELVGWFSPTYKLLLPTYKRILRTMRPLVEHSSKVDSLIELATGGSVEFWTLSDEDAGRSRSYDRVIIDEASLVKKGLRQTWEQSIAPTLLDRRGKAVIAGTPKGIDDENFFYAACTDPLLGFVEYHAPTRANPMLDPVGVANLQNEYPPLVYQQEFLAEFIDWSGVAFFGRDALLDNGQPVAMPTRCDTVFVTIDSASKTGKERDGTGVIFWAYSRIPERRLWILDWDITQIEGALLETWLPTAFARLEELSRLCGARMGSIGAHIEDQNSGVILIQQAQRRGWDAHPIESKLTSLGKDERAINVSGYHFRGMVKITAEAFNKTLIYKEKARNHLMHQILNFRIADKDAAKREDDLLDCYCYGLMIGFGDSEGF